MKGLLIYDTIGKNRNEWFINALINTAKKYDIELELLVVDGNEPFSLENFPDIALVRVIAPQINEYLEKNGVKVFNNYKTSYCANNKWNTYLLSKELGINVMNTTLPDNIEDITYPFVVKSLDGHGGSEVFLVNSSEEYDIVAKKLKKDYLIQEKCSNVGKDVRVYSLDGEIVASILRESESDFRSNFSLGGRVSVFEATDEMKNTVKKLYDTLGFSLVGVDFISHNGKWVLNELEDVVGTRMLYKCTDIDIVDMYLDSISKKIKSV